MIMMVSKELLIHMIMITDGVNDGVNDDAGE